MEGKEKETPDANSEESLSKEGDKEKAANIKKGILTWDKDMVFTARIGGYAIDFDAAGKEGCAPTDSLLMSLPGCLAIDIVVFLRKMKTEIKKFDIETTGEANPAPPKYFKAIHMKISIAGKGITPEKLEKAINLSQKKYCSVRHSLRKDMDIIISYEIAEHD